MYIHACWDPPFWKPEKPGVYAFPLGSCLKQKVEKNIKLISAMLQVSA